MICIATDFLTSLAVKKPRGKNHKVSTAQVCLTCWVGLPVTVCASQAITGDLGGTGPVCPWPSSASRMDHTGKDGRKTTRNISDWQQLASQATTKSWVRLRKEHILLDFFLTGQPVMALYISYTEMENRAKLCCFSSWAYSSVCCEQPIKKQNHNY